MRYYHIIKDSKGSIKEQQLCNDDKSRFSLECLKTVLNGTYEIIPQPNN